MESRKNDGRPRSRVTRTAVLLAAAAWAGWTAAPAAAQDPDTTPRAIETPEEIPIPDPQEEASVRRLTLQEAVDIALRRNPGLDRARNSVELAGFDRLDAYGDFLPDLSMNYGYSNASTGRLDPTGQAITRTSYSVSLGASYDLFTGLRRFSSLRTARLGLAAENARYRESEFSTVLQVKQTFYNAVAARELVDVEVERVERQRDQLEFVEQQVDLGRATRADLLRSQVDLNNALLGLLNARNDARDATFRLAASLGVEERVAPAEEATLEVEPFPFEREELVAFAMQSAPSVNAASAAAEAAEASVASARSTYLPSLRFGGGWAWQAADFPPSNRSWSLQVQGSYPLFNGFERETQVYRARAQAENARAQEREAELALRADVDAAYSQIEAALAGIALAEQSVELSRESLRVVQERYRLGLATILDLQAAQIALRESQVDLVNRRFDHQLGIAELESLLGRELVEGTLREGF